MNDICISFMNLFMNGFEKVHELYVKDVFLFLQIKQVQIVVKSDIPLGAGLGSSAAVSVATVDAVSRTCDVIHPLEHIATLAHEVEQTVQGRASRADTFCSTMGGFVCVEGKKCNKLPFSKLPLTIGYDGGFGSTKELVSMVKTNKENYDFIGSIITSIGSISKLGIVALENQDRSY